MYKFDFTKITIREYRSLFETSQKPEDGDAIVAKVTGMSVDEIQSLSYDEYKRLTKEFFDAARKPIDPN